MKPFTNGPFRTFGFLGDTLGLIGKEPEGMKSHLQHHLNRLHVYYGEITVTSSEEQKSIARLTLAGKKLHFDDVVETVGKNVQFMGEVQSTLKKYMSIKSVKPTQVN